MNQIILPNQNLVSECGCLIQYPIGKYRENYSPFHLHDVSSERDGANDIATLMKRMHELSFKRFIPTNHASMAAIYESFKEAEKYEGMKSGIGCEFYMSLSTKMEERKNYHITTVVLNDNGYKEMLKLQYLANIKDGEDEIEGFSGGFFFRARVHEEHLFHFCKKDIAVTSGCRQSVFNQLMIEGNEAYAESLLHMFNENIENFFIELHVAHNEVEEESFWKMKKFAYANNIPTLIANDSHYTNKDDLISWNLLNSSRRNFTIDVPEEMIKNKDFHIKSFDEIWLDSNRCNALGYLREYNIYEPVRQRLEEIIPKYNVRFEFFDNGKLSKEVISKYNNASQRLPSYLPKIPELKSIFEIDNDSFQVTEIKEFSKDYWQVDLKLYTYSDEIVFENKYLNTLTDLFFLQIMLSLYLATYYEIYQHEELNEETDELFHGHEVLDKIITFDWYGSWDKRKLPMLYFPEAEANLKNTLWLRIQQMFGGEKSIPPIYLERLKKEWEIAKLTNNISYFYWVQMFLDKCEERGLMLPMGRGSAASLLICYLIKAAKVDPIEYDLIIERAMNTDRPKLMDIDLDFASSEAGIAVDIIKEMQGTDCVCKIAAYGVNGVKNAFQTVCKFIRIAPYLADEVSKSLSVYEDEESGEKSKANHVEQMEMLRRSSFISNLNISPVNGVNGTLFLDYVSRLVGTINSIAPHPSGILILNDPIWKFVPVKRIKNDLVCQWDMNQLESLNGLKVDILSVALMSLVREGLSVLKDFDRESYDLIFY